MKKIKNIERKLALLYYFLLLTILLYIFVYQIILQQSYKDCVQGKGYVIKKLIIYSFYLNYK